MNKKLINKLIRIKEIKYMNIYGNNILKRNNNMNINNNNLINNIF